MGTKNSLNAATPFHKWAAQPNSKTKVGGFRYLTRVGNSVVEVLPDFVETEHGIQVVYLVRVDDELVDAAMSYELIEVVVATFERLASKNRQSFVNGKLQQQWVQWVH